MTSTALFHVCDQTKQAIHVGEFSDKWFRGSDHAADIIGLFAYAHTGYTVRIEAVPAEEKKTALFGYEKWRVGTAFCLFEKATGETVPAWWQEQLKNDLKMRA